MLLYWRARQKARICIQNEMGFALWFLQGFMHLSMRLLYLLNDFEWCFCIDQVFFDVPRFKRFLPFLELFEVSGCEVGPFRSELLAVGRRKMPRCTTADCFLCWLIPFGGGRLY